MKAVERFVAAYRAFRFPYLLGRDLLTKAWTRSAFLTLFAPREIDRAARGEPFCVIYFDIDGLGKKNREEGHCAGDKHLQEFCEIVLLNRRSYDLFVRMGGDEFLLVLSGVSPEIAEKIIVKRIGEKCSARMIFFSYGITSYVDGDSMDEVIARADNLMREQKKRKKNSH